MSKLEKAFEAAKRLPRETQDKIADAILDHVADGREPEDIDPEFLPSILAALEEMKRGERASDEEVAAAYRLFEEG